MYSAWPKKVVLQVFDPLYTMDQEIGVLFSLAITCDLKLNLLAIVTPIHKKLLG